MLSAGQVLGEFEILGALGEGAMGQVYRARAGDGEVVALKVIAATLASDPGARQRFRSETEILTDLRQPRIVAARTGMEEAEGQLFYAMEFVQGTDLSELLAREGPLPSARALRFVADVLEALAYAHARDVLHRDVKASNVLVDAEDRAKLSDFGLARALDATRVTRPGSVLGTPTYMAPELAEGAEASVASEVYAVGVLLFELCAGAPPFQAGSALAVLHQHVHKEPPSLADARLDAIVRRALAKDPQERYRSATDMRDAVIAARAALSDAAGVDAPPAPDAARALVEAETRELALGSPGSAGSAGSRSSPESAGSPLPSTLELTPSGSSPQSANPEPEGAAAPSQAAPSQRGGGVVLALALGAVLLFVGLIPLADRLSAPPPSPPSPAQQDPASTSPTGSATASSLPLVEVHMRGGERLAAELVRADVAAGELVLRVEGRERRIPLDQVESYTKR